MKNPEQIASQMAKIRRLQIIDSAVPVVVVAVILLLVIYVLRVFGFRKLFDKQLNLPSHYALIPFYRYYVLFDEYWTVKYFWLMLLGFVFVAVGLLFGVLLYLDFDWFQIPWLVNPTFSIIALVIIILVVIGIFVIKFYLAQNIAKDFKKPLPWAFAITFVDFIALFFLRGALHAR